MPKHHRHKQREEHVARRSGLLYVAIAGAVLAVVLLLALQVGQAAWPAWLVTYRGQVIGLLGLALLAAVCAAPILIEANKRPRHLSGPGHNPEQGWRSKEP